MKRLKWIIIIVAVVFAGIQFFPAKRNQNDKILPSDITLIYHVPDSVQAILKTACYDCHSNNTRYPWYNKIQPVGWLLADHIGDGKKELNLSEFGSYSSRKKRSKLQSMENQIRKNKMPLFSYTLMHRDAVLSDSEKTLLINWIKELKKKN